MSYLINLLLLCSTFSAHADLNQDFSDLVSTYHQSRRFHGNVLVKHKGEIVFEKSIGEAVVEWGVEHTRDSKFMIASLSKSFTSALVLILQNQGKLSVEDFVADHISLPREHKVDLDKWKLLKIKHLLNHTGGVKRNFNNTSHLNRAAFNYPRALLNLYMTEKNIFASNLQPGEDFYYSNFGYLMLAQIVEGAGAGFYEDQLKNLILRPLGMMNTGEYHRSRFIENMAEGYFYEDEGRLKKRCCDDATSLRGAAGLYSTSGDLMTWLVSLQNSTEHFGFDLLSAMTEDSVLSGEAGLYSYGLMQDTFKDSQRFYHTGHEWGYISSMSFYPEEDLEIVVLSNRHQFMMFGGGSAADDLSLELAELML